MPDVRSTKIRKGGKGSLLMECIDCGNRERIPRHWLIRRSRPRCGACGGPFIETVEGADKLETAHTAKILREPADG